jgi:Domain of unknown function (DUF4329)
MRELTMSAVREQFHVNVLTKNYAKAATYLNGMSMAEILPALASIGADHRAPFAAGLIGLIDQINVPRLAFAINVVNDLSVPASAPGDLAATGQVEEARRFVAVPAIAAAMMLSPDAVAKYVIGAINPTSIAQNREFSGMIFSQSGRFGFTGPARSPDETAATPALAVPAGAVAVAMYHTHGAGFARINGSSAAEGFSIEDRMMSKKHDLDGYLGTPGGGIFKLTAPARSERGNLMALGTVSKL